jgi:hypothetical protein
VKLRKEVGIVKSMTRKAMTDVSAFGMGSRGYLPAFDLSLGGNAVRRCEAGVFVAPIAADDKGWSGFNGMIINDLAGVVQVRTMNAVAQLLPVPSVVQAQDQRHTETLAPYPWRPPA